MNDRGGHRLPVAIEQLLRAERQASPPPPEVSARVLRRLGQSVGLPLASSSWLGGKAYLVVALLAAGTVALVARAPRPPAPIEATAPARQTPVSLPAVEPPLAANPPAPPVQQRVDDGLARETALLVQARRALRTTKPSAALVPLRQHVRRWPRGALEQEREILLMETLARTGNLAAAQRRAHAFLRRFPRSTLADTARRWVPR